MSKLIKKSAHIFGTVIGNVVSGTITGIVDGTTTPAGMSARMLKNDYKIIDDKRNKIHIIFRCILAVFTLSLVLASLVYLLQTTDSSGDFLAYISDNWVLPLCIAIFYFLLYFGIVYITAVAYMDEYATAVKRHEQRLESMEKHGL